MADVLKCGFMKEIAIDNTAKYLGACADMTGQRPSLYRLMLEKGRYFGPVAPCPQEWRGMSRLCYANSANIAISEPKRVYYCEGYAISKSVPWLGPTDHAWLIDAISGLVVDPTWEDGTEYFGIAFRRSFLLERLLKSRVYGLLPDMRLARLFYENPSVFNRAIAKRAMKCCVQQ